MVKIRAVSIREEDLDFYECTKFWLLVTGCRREISPREEVLTLTTKIVF